MRWPRVRSPATRPPARRSVQRSFSGNARGGIEADLTITRLGEDAYLIVTGAAAATHNGHWIRRHLGGARAVLTDVTSAYAVLGVMGPRARGLLARLTDADLSNDAFPFGTSRELWLAAAPVRATRITYVGELGWELYVATEFAPDVYDAIVKGGAPEAVAARIAGRVASQSTAPPSSARPFKR